MRYFLDWCLLMKSGSHGLHSEIGNDFGQQGKRSALQRRVLSSVAFASPHTIQFIVVASRLQPLSIVVATLLSVAALTLKVFSTQCSRPEKNLLTNSLRRDLVQKRDKRLLQQYFTTLVILCYLLTGDGCQCKAVVYHKSHKIVLQNVVAKVREEQRVKSKEQKNHHRFALQSIQHTFLLLSPLLLQNYSTL